MKKLLVILITHCFIVNCFSQTSKQVNDTTGMGSTFNSTLPQFPDEMVGLLKYIQATMQYPAEDKAMFIEAVVTVAVDIDEKGNVTNATIIKPATEAMNKEALRIVKGMPAWKPAIQNGKYVAATYTLPIPFSLGFIDSPDPVAVPDN